MGGAGGERWGHTSLQCVLHLRVLEIHVTVQRLSLPEAGQCIVGRTKEVISAAAARCGTFLADRVATIQQGIQSVKFHEQKKKFLAGLATLRGENGWGGEYIAQPWAALYIYYMHIYTTLYILYILCLHTYLLFMDIVREGKEDPLVCRPIPWRMPRWMLRISS